MWVVGFCGVGWRLAVAVVFGVAVTGGAGIALDKVAMVPARGASVVTTIIITIGAAIFLRGAALLLWGKDIFALPHFSSEEPINVGAATMLPQNIWVLVVTAVVVYLVRHFFDKTLMGKAILACACNRTAAHLVGINVRRMMLVSYGLAAFLGAIAGILIAPIAFTSYDAGIMLGLKGFSAAILGGMGSSMGAVAGGVLLGVLESLGAGFISSGYKDAMAFMIILLVLFFKPSGLFGRKSAERV